jgi:hypothetical protein
VLFGKKVDSTENIYDLIAVSYKVAATSNSVSATSMTGMIFDGQTTKIPYSAITFLGGFIPKPTGNGAIPGSQTMLVGSPVIAPSGAYRTIVAWDGTNYWLDNPFNTTDNNGVANPACYLVLSSNFAACPALNVLATRTGLTR